MKGPVRHLFNLVLVVVLLLFVIVAAGYNEQARLMPLIIGIPILALAVLQTVTDLRGRGEGIGEKEAAAGEPGVTEATPDGRGETGAGGRRLGVYLWVVMLFILIYLLGFILTTFIYSFLSLKLRARLSWPASLAISGAALVFLWAGLIYALRVQLYEGVIVLALRQAILGY